LPQTYTLTRVGKLLVTRAAVMGPEGTKVINLLVDTGSTYTILPVEVLESVGLSPTQSKEHERIATGSGYIMAPKVTIEKLDTLGRQFRRVITIAHTLPFGGTIDGLLGMDLLCRMKAKILAAKGTIEF
jgi:predicted aspartyl protease